MRVDGGSGAPALLVCSALTSGKALTFSVHRGIPVIVQHRDRCGRLGPNLQRFCSKPRKAR